MKHKRTFRFLILFTITICFAKTQESYSQKKEADISVVDTAALTLKGGIYGNIINGQNFQQDALITHKGWQYISYYNAERNVCIGRRKLPAGSWEIIRFTDYYFSFSKGGMNDSHNTISMGICKNDGTIHLAFDHHASPLHYRVSKKHVVDKPEGIKWEPSLFSKVLDCLEEGKPLKGITYPTFTSTPQGDLLIGFRTGGSYNGDYNIGTYNGKLSSWGNLHQITSRKGDYQDPFKGVSPSRNAYINGLTFDSKGKLHVSWTWREKNESIANRDIGYAYSPDNGDNWYSNKNKLVASKDESQMINTSSPDIVVKELNRGWGMMNSQSQAIDNKGIVHIVMSHRKEVGEPGWAVLNKDAVYFHYYREKDGTWKENKLSLMGNRCKLVADKKNNLYLIFVRKDHFDSKDQIAPLIIARASAKARWSDWQEVYVSKENYFNEPQVDFHRWEKEHILSIMAQNGPVSAGSPSALKVVDVRF